MDELKARIAELEEALELAEGNLMTDNPPVTPSLVTPERLASFEKASRTGVVFGPGIFEDFAESLKAAWAERDELRSLFDMNRTSIKGLEEARDRAQAENARLRGALEKIIKAWEINADATDQMLEATMDARQARESK